MKRRWQLQEVKARLSEVVKTAAKEGPQEITVRGETAAVLLSGKDYARLAQPRLSFVEFLRRSPLSGTGLNPIRDRSTDRPVDL
jgi:prevent-host-death family protein